MVHKMLGPLSMMDNGTGCQTSQTWDSAQKQETEAVSTHMSRTGRLAAFSGQWKFVIVTVYDD